MFSEADEAPSRLEGEGDGAGVGTGAVVGRVAFWRAGRRLLSVGEGGEGVLPAGVSEPLERVVSFALIFCRAVNSERAGSTSPPLGVEGEEAVLLAPPGDVLAGEGADVGGEVREGPVLLSVASRRPAGGEGFAGLEDKALAPPPEAEGGDGEVLGDGLADGGDGEGLGAGGGDGLGAGLGAGVGGTEPIKKLHYKPATYPWQVTIHIYTLSFLGER